MKTQKLLSYLRKCIDEYRLVDPGDRIAVGLSGGKDSVTLLYGLAKLRAFYPVPFSLCAVIVDPGFGADFSPLEDFTASLSVPLVIERTRIAEIVFEHRREDHPCSLCANMRRGALTAAAERLNCTKLALGHHRDDYLTTFMLSWLYEGRIYTFAPKTRYEDRRIDIIRPMLYIPEGAVRSFVSEMELPIVSNPCPEDRKTQREEMNALLIELNRRFPGARERLLHAIRTSGIPDWADLRR
ncbi:MAG: tRNA 2-thiocytidine(32) synthetase TtcA [Lachnospiraceae bacterium]|nr:tRNA 2-thiocytidine(32) synthetase TtcA [Lachnospiraceae bacterium]